jgi:hypothetical protein
MLLRKHQAQFLKQFYIPLNCLAETWMMATVLLNHIKNEFLPNKIFVGVDSYFQNHTVSRAADFRENSGLQNSLAHSANTTVTQSLKSRIYRKCIK